MPTNFYLQSKAGYSTIKVQATGSPIPADRTGLKRIRLTIPEMEMHVNKWDKKRKRAKAGTQAAKLINERLEAIEQAIESLRETKLAIGQPLLDSDIRHIIAQLTPNNSSLPGLINGYLQKSSHLKDSSKKMYLYLINTLEKFNQETSYNLSHLGVNFTSAFTKWNIERGKQNRYIKDLFTKINAALNYFETYQPERGIKTIPPPVLKSGESQKIALTYDEIQKIQAIDTEKLKPYLRSAREIALFLAYTGLRYSDVKGLRWENIKYFKMQDRYGIDIIIKKTGKRLSYAFPFDWPNEYIKTRKAEGFAYPVPVKNHSTFGVNLKKVCTIAGIEGKEISTKNIGSKATQKFVTRVDKISPHTLRHSFVAMFSAAGGTKDQCIAYTGHKDYSGINPYWGQDDHAREQIAQSFLSKLG